MSEDAGRSEPGTRGGSIQEVIELHDPNDPGKEYYQVNEVALSMVDLGFVTHSGPPC